MTRIPLLSSENLTPQQRLVYDKVVAGPRGTIVGPLRAALHVPELADRWQHLGEYLRYRTSLSPKLSELAILVTARYWCSQLEWQIHGQVAAKAGIGAGVIESIRKSEAPVFQEPNQAAVFEFARQLLEAGTVSDDAYADAHARLGTEGLVELAALIGYYTMVALTLNVHKIMPAGGEQPLDPNAGPLPPARSPGAA